MYLTKIMEDETVKDFVNSQESVIENTEKILEALQFELFNYVKENISDFISHDNVEESFENIKQYAFENTMDKIEELSDFINDDLIDQEIKEEVLNESVYIEEAGLGEIYQKVLEKLVVGGKLNSHQFTFMQKVMKKAKSPQEVETTLKDSYLFSDEEASKILKIFYSDSPKEVTKAAQNMNVNVRMDAAEKAVSNLDKGMFGKATDVVSRYINSILNSPSVKSFMNYAEKVSDKFDDPKMLAFIAGGAGLTTLLAAIGLRGRKVKGIAKSLEKTTENMIKSSGIDDSNIKNEFLKCLDKNQGNEKSMIECHINYYSKVIETVESKAGDIKGLSKAKKQLEQLKKEAK